MKPVYLSFTNDEGEKIQTFVTSSIKTGLVDKIIDLTIKAAEIESGSEKLTGVADFIRGIKAVVLEAYKYKFSLDELNENVEQEDLIQCFKELSTAIAGNNTKNT